MCSPARSERIEFIEVDIRPPILRLRLVARKLILYGLTLESEVPLPARFAEERQAPDHWIAWGNHRPVTTDPPPGDIVARCCLTETVGATLVESTDRYTYRVHNVCDFDISIDHRR